MAVVTVGGVARSALGENAAGDLIFARSQGGDRTWGLAPALVRNADHGDLRHVWVG
jgi:hypothetical protein